MHVFERHFSVELDQHREGEHIYRLFCVMGYVLFPVFTSSLLTSPHRFLLCGIGHRAICCVRKHHTRSLTVGHATRNVVERIEHCVAHRRTYRGRTAQEEGWTNRLYRSTSVVWCVSDGRDDLVSCFVHRDCSHTKEGLESIGIHKEFYI
jgi:hypothetical protein